MSSPARSSASSAGLAAAGVVRGAADDNPAHHLLVHLATAEERKEEALLFLKSEVMAELDKAVKSLDEDSWMFARPRSRIHLLSRPGSHSIRRLETAKNSTNWSTDGGNRLSNLHGLHQGKRFTTAMEPSYVDSSLPRTLDIP